MDATAALVQHLLATPSVATAVTGNIFGETAPPGSVPPFILVRSVMRTPFTRPTTVWWQHTVTVDVHSEDPSESHDVSVAVEKAVDAWTGASDLVLAGAEVENTAFFEDGAFTPVRYRNVVTVGLTARD